MLGTPYPAPPTMTARDDTHRETVNPTGAHEDDVQQIVTLLQQRSGSVTVDYLREIAGYPEPQLRACVNKLRDAGRIEVRAGVSRLRIELRGQNSDNHIVTDGSGRIEDIKLSIPSEVTFDLLSSDRRRELIKMLAEITPHHEVNETYHELRDLATVVAMRQIGKRASELSHQQRNRVYISLCQVHAEALDNTGVVTYYDRVQKIGPTKDVFALAEIVEVIQAASSEDY
mgnify:FL=1